MKRSIVIVLIGLAATLAFAEVGLRLIDGFLPTPSSWPSVETDIKDRQLKMDNSYEVIFLGSSVTEASIDPEALPNGSAYNAALPFSSPISNYIWYKNEFGASRDVELVILGLLAWPYHSDNDSDALASMLKTISLDRPGFLDRFSLWTHRGMLADWLQLVARERAVRSSFWTERGHQTGYYERTREEQSTDYPDYGPPKMSADAEEAIRLLGDLVERQGARLVLMVEPPEFPGTVSPDAVATFLGSLHDLAAELDVELWDTYSVGWDPALFADDVHFNRSGTMLYTSFIADLLDSSLSVPG